MSHPARLPAWARIALIVLAVVAFGRALVVVRHDPLLAYANNYDQIRFTACLDLAPWRPGVGADVAHPSGPLSRFAFQPLSSDACLWTSDLLFTAPVALAWRIGEAAGGRPIHSVRRLAEFRLVAWFAVALWATLFFLRERRVDIAIAHLAWLALVGVDPANTLYLATFYAEPAAVFGAYACGVGAIAALLRPTRGALAMAAFGALVLAASKFQHLLLPMALAFAVLIGARRAGLHATLAILVGAVLGCAVQIGNEARGTWMIRDIGMINRADYVLTVLLPETSDRARVAKALDIDDTCLAYSGKNVYEIPIATEKACKTVHDWRRGTMWWLLVSDPPALVRALSRIPELLLPWQSEKLGLVEGIEYGKLPASSPSLNGLFGRSVAVAWTLLAMPWIVCVVCVLRRAPASTLAFALLCAVGSSAVAIVALLGDGDVEYAKHAQLVIDFALAGLTIPFAAAIRRLAAH